MKTSQLTGWYEVQMECSPLSEKCIPRYLRHQCKLNRRPQADLTTSNVKGSFSSLHRIEICSFGA